MEQLKYFFSYSRSNSEYVLKLATDLKEAGANVWVDQLDILPGSNWDESVESALNDSTGMIVILSRASVKSQNVKDEVSYGISQGKRIVPLMIEDCSIPFRLARRQYIDFNKNYDLALKQLLNFLNSSSIPPAENLLEKDEEEIVKTEDTEVVSEGVPKKTSVAGKSKPGLKEPQEQVINNQKVEEDGTKTTYFIIGSIILVIIIIVASIAWYNN